MLAALVVAYLMQGLVTALNRYRVPPVLSVNLVFLVFLTALVAVLV
ncbi:MAG TPA: AI-2E family transporter, partial [Alcanivorax sp.]|nr:AI-2E family transporter [Alcanivorax sp.]